jgi:hypothetical protein
MSRISKEQFQAFYDGQQDSRYGEFSQDFNLLASDDSVEFKELTDILDGDEDYDKKRVAYEIIVACFPEEAKAVAKPQPGFMDSAWTAGGAFIDHYTRPFTEAFDDAVSTYDTSLATKDPDASLLDSAASVVPALWSGADTFDDSFDSVVGIVSWVNPIQGIEEAADAVMKKDFEAGSHIDGTYATAAVVRTATGVVDNIVNGAAALGGTIVYFPVMFGDGTKNLGITAIEDLVSDSPDAIDASDYLNAIGEESFGHNDAAAMGDFVWHAIKIITIPLGIPYGIWETLNDPAISDKFTTLKNSPNSEMAFLNCIDLLWTMGTTYPGKFFEYFGTDLQALGGYDPNDPDSVSRWLNVVDTLVSYIIPFTKGGKAKIKAVHETIAKPFKPAAPKPPAAPEIAAGTEAPKAGTETAARDAATKDAPPVDGEPVADPFTVEERATPPKPSRPSIEPLPPPAPDLSRPIGEAPKIEGRSGLTLIEEPASPEGVVREPVTDSLEGWFEPIETPATPLPEPTAPIPPFEVIEHGEPGALYDASRSEGDAAPFDHLEEGPAGETAARERIDPAMLKRAEEPVEAGATESIVAAAPIKTPVQVVETAMLQIGNVAVRRAIGEPITPETIAATMDVIQQAHEAITRHPSEISPELLGEWNRHLQTFAEAFDGSKSDGHAPTVADMLAAARKLRIEVIRLGEEKGVISVDEVTASDLNLYDRPSDRAAASAEADPLLEDFSFEEGDAAPEANRADSTALVEPTHVPEVVPEAPVVLEATVLPAEPVVVVEPAPVVTEPLAPVEPVALAEPIVTEPVKPTGLVDAQGRPAITQTIGRLEDGTQVKIDPETGTVTNAYGQPVTEGQNIYTVNGNKLIGVIYTDGKFLQQVSDGLADVQTTPSANAFSPISRGETVVRDPASGSRYVIDTDGKILGGLDSQKPGHIFEVAKPKNGTVFKTEGKTYYTKGGQLIELPKAYTLIDLGKGDVRYVKNGQLVTLPKNPNALSLDGNTMYHLIDGRLVAEVAADGHVRETTNLPERLEVETVNARGQKVTEPYRRVNLGSKMYAPARTAGWVTRWANDFIDRGADIL